MKRLLVVSPHYHTFVKGQVEAVSKYFDEVNVLVHHNHLSEIAKYIPLPYFRHVEKFSKAYLVDKRNIPDNVRVHMVSTLYFTPDGKNLKLGDKLAKKFERFVRDNKIDFDLIHAHFTWPSGYAAVKLGKRFEVPTVITAHGYDVYDLPFRSDAWFEKIKFVLNSATHIITVSRSNFEIITSQLCIPGKNVSIIPNGFDSDLFNPSDKARARKKLALPQDKKILLNVGNLVPVKGHEHLIKAMVNVLKARKDVLLVIIGDGPLRDRLDDLVRKLGLDEYIKFVGSKPHHEIPLWMNGADVFVLPSLSEGNPTVMFEALGVGLPFVGTAVGGVPEIITSEDYGLLCPPADLECLAEKILIALDKEWDRERIRKYAEQFTWERVAEKVMGVYNGILKE